jgi:UDPglucose 6-dehydrogenase
MKKAKNSSISAPTNFKKKKITIIGSGFVGTATGKGFLNLGHDVSFADINTARVENLSKEGLIACDIEGECRNDRDIYMVSVLTPTINDHLDFRFIDSAIASLGQILKNNTRQPIVVIRSTVPPGTTENRFVPILEKYSGKKVGKDFGIAMNPEFLREVSAEQDFAKPWIVVIGSNNPKTAKTLDELFQPFKAPISHMAIKEAEMMKYVHNLFNANKISFFNEMRLVAETIGADADKIFKVAVQSAEGSWNKNYGTKNMGPFGGSCLPKDTMAFLTWADENIKKKMPLLHATIRVNENLKDKQYLEY